METFGRGRTGDGGKHRRTLTLTDPDTGLEVRAVATTYVDTPSVEWTLYFTNKGDKDTPILEQIKAVDTTVKSGVSAGARLLRLTGSPCRVDDWLPLEDALQAGKAIEFAPTAGRSSNDASPFFNLQWPAVARSRPSAGLVNGLPRLNAARTAILTCLLECRRRT